MNLEPIRALVSDLNKYQDHKVNSGRIINASTRALPALSQLLEAVTNLENLEAEWRNKARICNEMSEPTPSADHALALRSKAIHLELCADDLKRLLHPEDK